MRTINPQPRVRGALCVYTVVDEHLRYVRVYIPFAHTDAESVRVIVNQVLAGRTAPLPKEAPDGE